MLKTMMRFEHCLSSRTTPFQATDGLDVLANNAGIGKFGKVSDFSLDEWDQVIGTNLRGRSIVRVKLCSDLEGAALATSSISAAWQEKPLSPAERLTARPNLHLTVSVRLSC